MKLFSMNKAVALDKDNIPQHVAVIMDGNGRWAKRRGLPRKVGHSAGSEAFDAAAEYFRSIGVKYFTVYAFSTENWSRPQDEVNSIMALLDKYLHKAINEMAKKNIRLRFWGDISVFSPNLQELIKKSDELSTQNDGFCVNICLNYGGRDEIVRATKALAQQCVDGCIAPSDINSELFSNTLYSAGIPDPDLMIRPGAEQRLSNFLLWQNAYSEFYFTKTLWPDMNERQLEKAILEFQQRKRRFGGI